MDAAVGLVQSYLRVNGFFTVTEYPIVARSLAGRTAQATQNSYDSLRVIDSQTVSCECLNIIRNLSRGQRQVE